MRKVEIDRCRESEGNNNYRITFRRYKGENYHGVWHAHHYKDTGAGFIGKMAATVQQEGSDVNIAVIVDNDYIYFVDEGETFQDKYFKKGWLWVAEKHETGLVWVARSNN